MMDVIEKINHYYKETDGDLIEKIDYKCNPLYKEYEYLQETILSNDVKGKDDGLHTLTKRVSGSKDEETSYHNYPDSGYGGDDDYSVRNRRVDKKQTRWLKVKDTFLDLFVMDVVDDTPIETDDEDLPDDLPKDFKSKEIKESGVLSNKSTLQKKRYGKKYYSKNRVKILRKKKKERRETLNKKKTEYRKDRNKKVKTPTGKRKLKYHTKKHLEK